MLRSIPEAARLLGGVNESTVRRLIRRGELRRTRVGSRVMIDDEDLAAYVAAHKVDDGGGPALPRSRSAARRRHPSNPATV